MSWGVREARLLRSSPGGRIGDEQLCFGHVVAVMATAGERARASAVGRGLPGPR